MGTQVFSFLVAVLISIPSMGDDPRFCTTKTVSTLKKFEFQITDDSKQLAQKLIQSGFDCGNPPALSERGYRCRGKIDGYPQPVNIYIPSQFQRANAGPLAVHFHGHNLYNHSDTSLHFNITNGNGDYGKMLTSSGANSLLIIPESLGKCETYEKYFRSPKDLDSLLQSVENLTQRKISTLAFSSHSGGDRTMDRLASWYLQGNRGNYLEKTNNIGLFDSLYSRRQSLAAWPEAIKKENSNSGFIGSYVVGPGASTTQHMSWLKTKIPVQEGWEFREVQTQHMAIMRDGGFSDFLGLVNKK